MLRFVYKNIFILALLPAAFLIDVLFLQYQAPCVFKTGDVKFTAVADKTTGVDYLSHFTALPTIDKHGESVHATGKSASLETSGIIILSLILILVIYSLVVLLYLPMRRLMPLIEDIDREGLVTDNRVKTGIFSFNILYRIKGIIEHLKHKTKHLESIVEEKNKELQRKEFYINHMHNAVWALDENNNTVDVNPAFTELFGYAKEEMLGKNVFEFFDEKNKDIMNAEFSKRRMKTITTYEINIITKTGKELPILITGVPIIENDKLVGKLGVITDISSIRSTQAEIRQKNVELERANKTKSEFLANMSHELRTPLNAVIGFSEILLMESMGELNEKQKDYIKSILESGEYLLNLINDILDLSRVESGQMIFEPSEFYIKDAVEQSIAIIKERALKKRINIHVEYDETVSTIYADERKIKQVLYNLLSNAIKFTPSGGNVTVRINMHGSNVLFTVEDSGIGIPKELIPMLFQPFSQLHPAHESTHEGTGLGLTIVKSIIELHGGDVWVESTPAKGSQFYFTIPADIKHGYAKVQSQKPQKTGKCNTAFVIEWDQALSKLIRSYLEDAGLRVESAYDGDEALTRLNRFTTDIIILNPSIPNSNGWHIIKSLRENPAVNNIPIVVISSIEESKDALKLGASAFILVPFDKKVFIEEINKVCGRGS